MRVFLKLTLLFTIGFTSGLWATKSVLDRTVVTVNDEIILESDIQKFQQKLRSKSYQELLGVDDKVAKNRETTLQLLVEEKIIDQQVKKLDLTVSEQEIEGQIRSIVKRNGITVAQLTDRLKQLGTSMSDYREGLKRQLERRNLVEREIKPTLEVTEEQLRHYYLRNGNPSDAETQYKIAHILIVNKEASEAKALERSRQIYTEVSKSPGEFEKFAKDFSDDETTSNQGGVLGYFTDSQLSKEFRAVIPKTQVGNVTPPIKTEGGYHIVRLLEKSAGDFSKLPKERKEALKNQMSAEELEKKMALWLERKKSESHIKRFVTP